jgi:hypothetical protein
LLALVLSLHEGGSAAWTWLNLLAAVALVRVAPAGRFMTVAKAYRTISALLLVAILVPFTVGQIRDAIYPQLERQAGAFDGIGARAPDDIYPASAPVAYDAAVKMESTVTRERVHRDRLTAARAGKSYSLCRQRDRTGRPGAAVVGLERIPSRLQRPGRCRKNHAPGDHSGLAGQPVAAAAGPGYRRFRRGICVRNPRTQSGLANTWRTASARQQHRCSWWPVRC